MLQLRRDLARVDDRTDGGTHRNVVGIAHQRYAVGGQRCVYVDITRALASLRKNRHSLADVEMDAISVAPIKRPVRGESVYSNASPPPKTQGQKLRANFQAKVGALRQPLDNLVTNQAV